MPVQVVNRSQWFFMRSVPRNQLVDLWCAPDGDMALAGIGMRFTDCYLEVGKTPETTGWVRNDLRGHKELISKPKADGTCWLPIGWMPPPDPPQALAEPKAN